LDIEAIKRREKAYHERVRRGDEPFPTVSVDEMRQNWLSPTWSGGRDRYNDCRIEFYRLIEAREDFHGKDILDYACGFGMWSIYYRLRGARSVVGFDIAEDGVRRGLKTAQLQGEGGTVKLLCADASQLPFRDRTFKLVIGQGVIHHVIKYPGIFPELFRVMADGGRAYFLENLADNPLFGLYWRLKGEVEEGDVPIRASDVRDKARQFRGIEVHGFDFFHSLSHYVFRYPSSGWRRAILRLTKSADDVLFRVLPLARRGGSMAILVFEKSPP
jgi:ubiquinone/menaquinone biosynthesis C-methylase UbiE